MRVVAWLESGASPRGGWCSFPFDGSTTGPRYGNHADHASGDRVPDVRRRGGHDYVHFRCVVDRAASMAQARFGPTMSLAAVVLALGCTETTTGSGGTESAATSATSDADTNAADASTSSADAMSSGLSSGFCPCE